MAEPPEKSSEAESRRSVLLLIAGLVVAALAISGWRLLSQDEHAISPGDHAWDITLDITAAAVDAQTRVSVARPIATRHLHAVGQTLSHPGWRQVPFVETAAKTGRRLMLVATRNGQLSAQLVFTVYQSATPRLATVDVPPATPAGNEAYLRDHPVLQITHDDISSLVGRLESSADNRSSLVDRIFTFTAGLAGQAEDSVRAVPEVLAAKQASRRERAYTMVALCRAAGIPARLVRGFILGDAQPASLHFWLEVYGNGEWVPFDPVFQHQRAVPPNYQPFARGINDVVIIDGTSEFNVSYAVTSADLLMDAPDPEAGGWLGILNLGRLPLETRISLAGLMLLPFGVWLTAAAGQLVGLRFYGVFTPALLAFSLTYVPWQAAGVILAVVLALGVVGRSAVPREFSRVIRLSIVFILVALSLALSASLMDRLGIGFGGHLVLLPIVVLVSLVDRFYSVLDESGLHIAVVRLAWTVVLATLCIPVFQIEALGHLLIRHPEIHLLTLAATLALGLHRGRRLSQVPGFGWLATEHTLARKS